MGQKQYRMVHNWQQVVSKPTDAVYLTEMRRRGELVRLDENGEDARRLFAAGSIVARGDEPDDLKAELKDGGESDRPVAASSGSAQTSSAAVPPGEDDKARLHTSTPN